MCNPSNQCIEKFNDGIEKSRDKIREYPIASVAIAAGVGIGIGVISGLLISRRFD